MTRFRTEEDWQREHQESMKRCETILQDLENFMSRRQAQELAEHASKNWKVQPVNKKERKALRKKRR